jgi:hypothetical protein
MARKICAGGAIALGLLLAFVTSADAATAGGGFRGGGGGFRAGGGFRGGEFRGGFRGGEFRGFRGGYFGPRFGFGLGFYDPFWWPWYYPWYYPYAPREVILQYAPPVGYLPLPEGAAAVQQYWYRCANPQGYYPYIQQCNSGWESVPVAAGGAQPGPAGPPQ